MNKDDILLSLENVSKSFFSSKKQTEVLSNISFNIQKNEIIALLGPSGCGKSTLLNILSSLEEQTSGTITLNGKLGYMFQKDALLPWRNIFSNICLGLEIKKKKTNENIEYANELIKKYKLNDFINNFPNQISGGMKQRVALIRTLVLKPDLLLLDEPFSALDAQTKIAVQNDVYNIIKQEKKSALIVTHDIGEAIALADKIIILSDRPAKVKKIVNIKINNLSPLDELSASETLIRNSDFISPLERRNNSQFNEYHNQISHLLGIL